MSELVLSASSTETYLACHYRWYLQYVEGHVGDQSTRSAVGMAVHAAVEHYAKSQLEGPLATAEEVSDVVGNTFWFEMFGVPDVDPELPDPVKAVKIARRCADVYVEDVVAKETPVLIEHAGRITVNGIPYSFHIDRTNSLRVVVDLKVKGQKPRHPEEWSFAATGYALGYRAETGEIESDVRYDVTMRLKRDRPYVVPYSNGGPVSPHAIGIFARTLETVANDIDRGDYRATGLEKEPWVCRFCPVKNLCEPYLLLQEGAD